MAKKKTVKQSDPKPAAVRWYRVLVWPGLSRGEKPRMLTVSALRVGLALELALERAGVEDRGKHTYTIARIPTPEQADDRGGSD